MMAERSRSSTDCSLAAVQAGETYIAGPSSWQASEPVMLRQRYGAQQSVSEVQELPSDAHLPAGTQSDRVHPYPDGQAAHEPQCSASFCVSKQSLPHAVRPRVHAHDPQKHA